MFIVDVFFNYHTALFYTIDKVWKGQKMSNQVVSTKELHAHNAPFAFLLSTSSLENVSNKSLLSITQLRTLTEP